ncbi:MAG: hypothetical protein AAF226_15290, partial [Verrucomicrobiota bacterium]
MPEASSLLPLLRYCERESFSSFSNPFPIEVTKQITVPATNEIGPFAFESVLAILHQHLKEAVIFEYRYSRSAIRFLMTGGPEVIASLEAQVYAVYADAKIECFELTEPQSKVRSFGCLVLTSPALFPIKRYQQFYESDHFADPLAGILSALQPNETIRFSVQAVSSRWNRHALSILDTVLATQLSLTSPIWLQLFSWAALDHRKWQRVIRWPIAILFKRWSRLFPTGNGNVVIEPEPQTSGQHDRESIRAAAFDNLSHPAFLVTITLHSETGQRAI